MKGINTNVLALITALAILKHNTDLLIIRMTNLKNFSAFERMLIGFTT
jgi:hypothetical protein